LSRCYFCFWFLDLKRSQQLTIGAMSSLHRWSHSWWSPPNENKQQFVLILHGSREHLWIFYRLHWKTPQNLPFHPNWSLHYLLRKLKVCFFHSVLLLVVPLLYST
jgi:hypothetical protein